MACWLITGAGRGIGLGLTARLLERGDEVIALVRDPAKAHDLQQLSSPPNKLTLIACDVTSQASLLAARAQIGPRAIDVLVNNAGAYGERGKGVLTADIDVFADILTINTIAPLRVIQAFAPLMGQGQNLSKIATISSAMGSFGRNAPGEFVYRTSKAAINKAIQSVADELLQKGMIAFVMHPGWVRTDMGGQHADIPIEDSVRGLIATIEKAGKAEAGCFLNYDGSVIPW